MKKYSKILALILTMALLVSSLVIVNIAAEEATPSLEIVSKNLSYESNIRLLFAVKSENIGDATVELKVYDADPSDNADLQPKEVVAPAYSESINSYGDCDIFFTTGIAAKYLQMQIYAQAEVTVNKVTYKSEVVRYSIVEYCHEMIAKPTTDADKDAKYMNVIEYGAAIQSFLADDTDANGNPKYEGAYATDYKYVTIDGGTLDGRYSKGIYLSNTKLTPYAAGADKWYGTDGTVLTNGEEYIVRDTNVDFSHVDSKTLATIDFEKATTDSIPSAITFSNSHPTLPFGTNTYSSGADKATVGKTSGNSTNSLILDSSRSYTRKNILKIFETADAETNANTVEFSMDFMSDWSTSGTGAEFINIVFTDKDDNVAFNLILCQNTATGLQLRFRDSAGAQSTYTDPDGKSENYGRTFLASADGVWTNITLKYTSDGNSMALSVARGDNQFFTGSKEPGAMISPFSSNCVKASDITNVYVIINGHREANHTLNNITSIDNLIFRKIAE